MGHQRDGSSRCGADAASSRAAVSGEGVLGDLERCLELVKISGGLLRTDVDVVVSRAFTKRLETLSPSELARSYAKAPRSGVSAVISYYLVSPGGG